MPERRIIRVSVLVVGDLGRSPRMQYHALALVSEPAEAQIVVDLVGCAGSAVPRVVREHARIDLHLLRPLLPGCRGLPRSLFLGYALIRAFGQCLQLLYALLIVVRRPDFILVQNPPALPTLLVALIAARLRSAKLVIDWHNFGYTMLALRLGRRHPVVRLAHWCERLASRFADWHLCVSRAMQRELEKNWAIPRVRVLYDRPAEQFAPTPLSLRHELFRRLQNNLAIAGAKLVERVDAGAQPPVAEGDAYREETLLTSLCIPRDALRNERVRHCLRARDGGPAAPQRKQPVAPGMDSPLLPFLRLRSDRPALIVSSTSWTPDEDFSLLLDAATHCDELIQTHKREAQGQPFPPLLFLITGQGPLREQYAKRMERMALYNIHLRTLWLSAEEYPLLLGAADVGICLHRSSSGFDLPMKLADMFGSGLPVCVYDYGPCIAEQVRHGENGLLFSNSSQLAGQLYDLFKGFPNETPHLDRLRRQVHSLRGRRWVDGWTEVARPVFVGS